MDVAAGGTQRWCTVAPVLLVSAVAVVDPAGLAPFGPAKWAAVTTAALAVVAVAIGRDLRLHRPTALAWAVFLVAAAIAASLGDDPLYAWIGTPERHFGWLTWGLCALTFVAGQQLAPHRRTLVIAVAGVGTLLAAVAVGQLAGTDPIGVELVGGSSRPGSLLGSPAFLGAALCLALPAALASATVQRLAFAAVAIVVAGLAASGARAAWIGTAVAALAAGLAIVRRRRRTAAPGAVPRAALLIIAFAAAAFATTGASQRVSDAFTTTHGGVQGRLDEWRVASRVIAERPITGTGPEGYRIAFAASVDEDYDEHHGRDPLPDRAHSALLDVAATTGIPGAVAYGALVALVAARARRALLDGDRWSAALAAGLTAYFAQSLFLFPLAEIEPLAWLLAGVVVATTTPTTSTTTIATRRAATPIAIGLAAVAAVAGALDVAADRAARTTLEDVATGRSPEDPDAAARLRPDAVRYRLVAVRGHAASTEPGAYRSTLDQLQAAAALSPDDPVVRNEHARVLLARAAATEAPEDVDRAVSALRALARQDPVNGTVQRRLEAAIALKRAVDGT